MIKFYIVISKPSPTFNYIHGGYRIWVGPLQHPHVKHSGCDEEFTDVTLAVGTQYFHWNPVKWDAMSTVTDQHIITGAHGIAIVVPDNLSPLL